MSPVKRRINNLWNAKIQKFRKYVRSSVRQFQMLILGTKRQIPFSSKAWHSHQSKKILKMHFSCQKSNKEKNRFPTKFIANRRNTFNSKYFFTVEKTRFYFQQRKKRRIFRCLNWGSDNNRLLKLKAHVNRNIKRYAFVVLC